MPIRIRLVGMLLLLHLASSLVAGGLTWWWLDGQVRSERQARGAAIARVLAGGGFSTNPEVLGRMAELAGTRFRIVTGTQAPHPGSVRVNAGTVTIEVDMPEDGWRRVSAASVVAALVFLAGGAAIFTLSAWWTARTITGPVERLAAAARAIGAGSLDQPVPPAGSGEVAALARDLEQMRVRLVDLEATTRRQERLAVLGTFTATIAHEVRNPLSAIRLIVQTQRRQGTAPGLDLVEGEIERLDLVVDGLLGYARGMRVEPAPCALQEVVDDVLRLLDRQSRHAGVTLERVGAARVVADARRLRQLLLNLVLNAIQAQPEGGRVVVTVHADGLAVSDDGPGVDPALVPRLFASFVSGRPEGTGLGLHLAWSIAQAHGATMRYGRGEPRGAVFTLAGLAAADDGPISR
jgi:signal transduction histidine kinase